MCVGEVESGKKVQKIARKSKQTGEQLVGHSAHILCMAISSDGKYLVRTTFHYCDVPMCANIFFIYLYLNRDCLLIEIFKIKIQYQIII